MTDSTADILRKARDHIAQPGMWWQGGWAKHGLSGALAGEPCCAAGAVQWAVGGSEFDSRAGLVLCFMEDLLPDECLGDLSVFNDAPGRTQAEVVALFDRAIELAERETPHD